MNLENYPLPRWRAASGSGTTDVVYQAGSVTEVRATGSRTLPDGGVAWTFESAQHFTLEAEVRPVADEPPRISWKFTASTPGWYTVGYTGAPASNPATADGFLQPLIWQEKRFPRAPLLSAESMGGLPLTLVARDGVTHGLSVDPQESPIVLPTIANARFGVMLRNPKGEAQPSAFAPLLVRAIRSSRRDKARRSRSSPCSFPATGTRRSLKPRACCSASSTTGAMPGSRSSNPRHHHRFAMDERTRAGTPDLRGLRLQPM